MARGLHLFALVIVVVVIAQGKIFRLLGNILIMSFFR